MSKSVIFFGHSVVPAIGQGTWYMGERADQHNQEVDALRCGLDNGLMLIDTAEMYADGGAEEVVGEALQGRREQAFLVSKVYPWNAGTVDAVEACERSLRRLQTDYLDLYLLHWRGNIPLEETIAAMETLRRTGKILRWGVSNFDSDDLSELLAEEKGTDCAANQVLYHLASRGIEYDLLPNCQLRNIPLMAYCPLAQAGRLRHDLMSHPLLNRIAHQKNITVAQLLLAWVIRKEGVIAIPKAGSLQHVKENAAALDLTLTSDELAVINQAFPPPERKMPLDVV